MASLGYLIFAYENSKHAILEILKGKKTGIFIIRKWLCLLLKQLKHSASFS